MCNVICNMCPRHMMSDVMPGSYPKFPRPRHQAVTSITCTTFTRRKCPIIAAIKCPDVLFILCPDEEFSPSERLHQPRHQPRHQALLRAQPEERRAPPRAYAPAVGPAPLIFLAPLAGIAALYAMAFVQQNPALLTLVTVSGRRKR